MLHQLQRTALVLVASAALTLPAVATAAAPAPTEGAPPSPRWAEITRNDVGFRYLASKHDSNLTVTRVGDRLVFKDRALKRFRSLPASCRKIAVDTGIGASCRIPATATPANPLRLEISPQAGNDRVNGSSLGAEFEMLFQGAAGDDVATGGAGDDELNGALDNDRLTGGAGADWIRPGPGNDIGDGGDGEDRLVGTDGADHLSGGEGEDLLEGGPGDDTLLGGPASDILLCGSGFDTTDDDGDLDSQVHHCEAVVP